MKRMMRIGWMVMLAVFSAQAEELVIAYHGKIIAGNSSTLSGTLPTTMAFKIYATASDTVPLWSRLMPVKVNADGTFYVELADSTGSESGSALYSTLGSAFAHASTNGAWLGITPAGTSEFAPRTSLPWQAAAQYADTTRTVSDLSLNQLVGESLKITNSVTVDTLSAASFTIVPAKGNSVSLVVPSGSSRTFSSIPTLKVNSAVSLIGKINTNPITLSTDQIVFWQNSAWHFNSYFSLISPKGYMLYGVNASSGISYVFGR